MELTSSWGGANHITNGASHKSLSVQNQTGWSLPSAFELEVNIFSITFAEISIWWQKAINLFTLFPLMLLAINVVFVKLSIKTFCNLCIGTYDISCKYNTIKLLTTQLQCFYHSFELFFLNLLSNAIFTSGTTTALCVIFLRSTNHCHLCKIIAL